MEKHFVRTTTFAVDEWYRVDIVESTDDFEAWIYHKDYGVKSLMFATPRLVGKNIYTFDEFVAQAESTVSDYIAEYREEYMEL